MLKRGSSELEDNELGFAYHVRYFVSLMAAIFASVILLFLLHPVPFGIEIAIAIIYTAAAWWQTFCRIRGENSSYSIQTAEVRQKVPRLLAIHFGFLVILFAGLILIPFLRLHVPPDWLKQSEKGGSKFGMLLIAGGVILLGTESLICRGILRRAVEAEAAQQAPPANMPAP